jgi:hypothetical protein
VPESAPPGRIRSQVDLESRRERLMPMSAVGEPVGKVVQVEAGAPRSLGVARGRTTSHLKQPTNRSLGNVAHVEAPPPSVLSNSE